MRLRFTHLEAVQRCLCPRLAKNISFNESVLRFTFISSGAKDLSTCSLQSPGSNQRSTAFKKTPFRSLSSESQSEVPEQLPRLNKEECETLSPLELVQWLANRNRYPDVFVTANSLMESGKLEPSLELYEILISVCARRPSDSLLELAFKLLQNIKDHGMKPTSVIYHRLLYLLSKSPDYMRRKHVLEEMRERWFQLSPEAEQWVIMGYVSDAQLEIAIDMVLERREKGLDVDDGVYRMLAKGLIEFGEVDEAYDILKRVLLRNGSTLLWDGGLVGGADSEVWKRLWYDLLDVSSRELHHEVTKQAWYGALGEGITEPLFIPGEGIRLQVLNTAARHGDVKLAESVMLLHDAELSERKEYHYAALVEAYARASNFQAIFTILTSMRQNKNGPQPLKTTYSDAVSIIGATAESTAAALVALQSYSTSDLLAINLDAVHLVMAAHIHQDDLETAFDLYKKLPELVSDGVPNTHTFNILLNGCAKLAQKDLAMYIASEMKECRQRPDEDTYDALIRICLSAPYGDTSYTDAFIYLEEMKDFGYTLGRTVYAELALRVSAEGDVDTAFRVTDEMDEVGYGSEELRKFLRRKLRRINPQPET